jgi:uncharacterized membrane protein YeaQ/YmgE (transglycosylase-associated protein family)
VFGGILAAVLSGFLIGAAARFIVPGPDPMPFWLTVVIGLLGSVVGGAIGVGLYGTKGITSTHGHVFVTVMIEILAAAALVALYRRFIQRRPIAGPGAYRFPQRGFGIERLRARFKQLGIDPDKLKPPGAGGGAGGALGPPADEVTRELEKLQEQRERGEITDEQYQEARERLRRF